MTNTIVICHLVCAICCLHHLNLNIELRLTACVVGWTSFLSLIVNPKCVITSHKIVNESPKIVYIVQQVMTMTRHDVPNIVTDILEKLRAMMTPEWMFSIYIHVTLM